MKIGRQDILWNYAATFLKIGSSVLLIPIILRMMPSETVGIWTVFLTITSFSALLDFGFNPSFTRNVSYIFSGVKSLKPSGVEIVDSEAYDVDYGLLNATISTMKWFYLRASIILFILLTTLGTWYISTLLHNYTSSHSEVYIAWILLCLINTYALYTQYYDALLQGKGLIKRSKQIIILGQLVYLIIASILILAGQGLIAVVSAQASSVLIIRLLSQRSFFNLELKNNLKSAEPYANSKILKAITPNALKLGLTSIGGFLVQRSALIIGALYLTLDEIASYGITLQVINIIAMLGSIYITTYIPKISQLRVMHNDEGIKQIYIKGHIINFLTFIFGGLILALFGKWAFEIINSQTQLLNITNILLALFLFYEQSWIINAGTILLSNNEVPFYKAALISGFALLVGLLIAFNFFSFGLMTLLLIPIIVDIAYQTWKWPIRVRNDLSISFRDVVKVLSFNIKKI